MKKKKVIIMFIFVCLILGGCGKEKQVVVKQPTVENPKSEENTKPKETEETEETEETKETPKVPSTHPNGWIPGTVKKNPINQNPANQNPAKPAVVDVDLGQPGTGVIVIDAGHQGKGNSELELIGPGATTSKPKVASGTRGVSTKIPEYELTLTVAIKLRDALVSQGYQVMMIRESHEVNISNKERAEIANQAGAAVFIRIHANGSNDSSVNGVLTACQTAQSPYCAEYYTPSRKLSDCVVNNMAKITGAKNRGVWETDAMSGTNWCKVPSTIVEMGFMTNPREDYLMSTPEYQQNMVNAMVKGINEFLGGN